MFLVTSNWFGEWGNYIMAYQESGACSSVPYKCLHIISSELYKSLIEKTECSEDGKSNVINSSSNSSPSFQNNFYPQNNLLSSGYHGGHNRFDGDDGDDNDPAPRPHPQLVQPSPSNLTPTTSPIQLPDQHSSENSPEHFRNADGATSNIGESTDDLVDIPSPNIDASTNLDDMGKASNTNDTVSQSTPSQPSMLKERLLRRSFVNKKPYNINRYKSSSSSIIPKKEESIPKKEEPMDTSLAPSESSSSSIIPKKEERIPKKEESMDTSLAPSVSNISPSFSQVTPHSSIKTFLPSKDGPKLSKATSKLKDEVKWTPHNKHQEVKIRKPPSKTKPEPKKRSFKFERNIPKIEDDLNDPMNGTHIEHIPLNENDEKMDTHIEHIPLNENDEKMDIDNFKFRRDKTYANTYKNRKYPKMTRKQNSVLKNISNDDLAKKKSKPKIRVRTDLFDKIPETVVKEISKDDALKQMTKPKIRVRTDLFKETPENNVSNKSSSNSLFKRTNNSSKKNVEKKQPYIRNIEKDKNKSLREKNKKEIAKNVRNFFAKNKQRNNPKFKVPSLKKSQFNETSNKLNTDFEMTDDSKIKIEKKIKPDKDSKTPLLIKRKIKKEIIEKGKNTKLSRNIKREMIGDEMIKSKIKPPNESKTLLNKKKIKKEIIEKGKNTKLSREIKREMIGEEMIKSKRKNPFATHPTGPIKFTKKKHKEMHDKEMKGSKRKNFFGTHPTGPIKFAKKNIKEKNDDTDSDNDNKDFKRKFSGSGFNMWKI